MYEITDVRAYPFKDIPDSEFQAYLNRLERQEDGFWKRMGSKEDLDLGFFRKVRKILDWSSKKDYVGARLTARMKYQMANIGLDDLREDVENTYSKAKAHKKISVSNDILNEAPELLKFLKDALEPGKFEKLVGWYFKKVGASQVDIPSKNMSGKTDYEYIDVTAYFSNLGTCYHVQVKFHDGISGEQAVAQVSKAKETGHYEKNDDDIDIYWALTAANSFTEEAKKIAEADNIRLITGPEFMGMLLDVGISDIDSAF